MNDERRFYREGRENDAEPIPVLTVSSGKGGVGKTVIAANLARLLSWSGQSILLVDLDLYNRGASALLADLVTKDHATVADLLAYAEAGRLPELPGAIEKMSLIRCGEASTPLFLLPSTRYNQQILGAEYEHDVPELKALLRLLLSELIRKYDLSCVVFDCRSGPEPLFLAAAGLATDTLLVTEADMVTWAGNMNLFNYAYGYYRNDAETLLNIQFVLNRVPDRYDETDLAQAYQRRLSRFLKGRRMLATIPFDDEVFHTFTQCAFFVDEHPGSIFSRRVAAIADELFATTHPELLSEQARGLAAAAARRGIRALSRKRPVWANLFLVIGALYTVAGLILLKADVGKLGQISGFLSVGAGLVALALSALHRVRLMG